MFIIIYPVMMDFLIQTLTLMLIKLTVYQKNRYTGSDATAALCDASQSFPVNSHRKIRSQTVIYIWNWNDEFIWVWQTIKLGRLWCNDIVMVL